MLVRYQPKTGGGLPGFKGAAIQRGSGLGGVLGGFLRNMILPAAKAVGRSLLKQGARKLATVASKVAEGQTFPQSIQPSTTKTKRKPANTTKRKTRTKRKATTVKRQPTKRRAATVKRQPTKRRKVNDIFAS